MTKEKIRSQEKALRMANATNAAKIGVDAAAGVGAETVEDAPIKIKDQWRSTLPQGVQAQGGANGSEDGQGGSVENEVKKPPGLISRMRTSSQVIFNP
jgi:hypothetical protein